MSIEHYEYRHWVSGTRDNMMHNIQAFSDEGWRLVSVIYRYEKLEGLNIGDRYEMIFERVRRSSQPSLTEEDKAQ